MESDPRINEVVTDISSYLQRIDWQDPWIYGLLAFHVVVSFSIYFTRKVVKLQIVLFFGLLVMIFLSQLLSEVAEKNWNNFSNQKNFDSKGLFISFFLLIPILLNCIFMLYLWFTQIKQLMAKLKTVQLKSQFRKKDEKPSIEKQPIEKQPIDSKFHQIIC